MEQFNGKVKLKITGEENFIVNTKMSKSLPEIFEFIGKTLLKLSDESYKKLVLNFKDRAVRLEDLKNE